LLTKQPNELINQKMMGADTARVTANFRFGLTFVNLFSRVVFTVASPAFH
jgi:hypothetical protein